MQSGLHRRCLPGSRHDPGAPGWSRFSIAPATRQPRSCEPPAPPSLRPVLEGGRAQAGGTWLQGYGAAGPVGLMIHRPLFMSLAKIVWSEARIATPHTIGTPPGMDDECDLPALGRNWPARRGLARSSSINGRKSKATTPFEYQDE